MIISHKYKFIFIKTAKTAGTSIEVFLSQCCSSNDIVTPIFPHVDPHLARNYKGILIPLKGIAKEIIKSQGHSTKDIIQDPLKMNKFYKFYNHISAKRIRSRVSKTVWNEYFKFCVERNPYDKTLSHYHMANDREGGNLSFDEYLKRGKFCLNYPRYTNSEGDIIVDKIIKYESLSQELYEVFNRLQIPFTGTLGIKAKSKHRKDQRSYQEVYTNHQRAIVTKSFSEELEMHGYTF